MAHDYKLPPNHQVGFLFSAVFAMASYYLVLNEDLAITSVTSIVSILFLAAAILVPSLLEPLNRSWMFFGSLLSRLTNPVVLGVVFFGLITPAGLIGKLFGRDELRLRSTHQPSKWIKRDFETNIGGSLPLQY